MRKIIIVLIILAIALPLLAKKKKEDAQKTGFTVKQNLKQLNAKYKKWTSMVKYIATDEEKDVFKRLPTIRDREMFIDFFWRQRDPSKGTERNEYKEEIEKRFRYVNEYFGRGTPLPGWQTDRGKIYMILGKPSTVENFDNEQGLYPARVWYYYGDKNLGLPTYFNIVFYKRRGTGDWVLYDPVAHGPTALLVEGDTISLKDYKEIYTAVKKLAPTLAGPSISMVPNQMPYNFRPSPLNNMIMANVYRSPVKKLNVSYATNFLDYKGFVDVESSVNYIGNSNTVTVVKDERLPFTFVQFSIKPKKLSVDYIKEENKYFLSFHVVAGLRQKGRVVYEYSRNFDFYVEPGNLEIVKAGGVVLHDYFPVIPGKYDLRVFIQSKIGKEFSYFDKELDITGKSSVPRLAVPLPGYKKELLGHNFFCAYRFNDYKLSVDTDKSFPLNSSPYFLVGVYNLDRKTWENGYVEWELKGQSERKPFSKKGTISLKDRTYRANMNMVFQVPETSLGADYYEFALRLYNHAGIVVDAKNCEFMVSPLKNLSRPTEMYNQLSVDNPYYFNYVLGLQYHNIGKPDTAGSYFQKSIIANPGFQDGRIAFVRTLLELKKYDSALVEAEKLQGIETLAFNYHAFKGEALSGLEKHEDALEQFLEANKIYNSDIRLINLMGMTFLKLGNNEQALKAFEASLKLEPKQPAVIETIEKIKQQPEKENK